MKIAVYKITILLIPFIGIALLIFIIDPYNYFNVRNGNYELKLQTAKPLNNPLWNFIDYKNSKYDNVLIGDSRMGAINPEYIKSICGQNYYNLSFGAANGNELIKTSEYILDNYIIKNIVIGINLDQYNQTNSRERISGIIDLIKNPFLYFTNLNVIEATYLIVKSNITDNNVVVNTIPDYDKNEFWKFQLDITGKRYYSNYLYPKEYYNGLKRIKEKCDRKNINLTIIIFPNHMDLNNLLNDYSLKAFENKFQNDMKEIGNVYDFNFNNPITNNKNNFNDPFHCNNQVISKIINIVWGNDTSEINNVYRFYSGNMKEGNP